MPDLINVLIVDDHPVMRQGIRALLEHETDLRVIGEAYNGEEAVKQSRELQPDVILMDLQLPGKSGIDAIKDIYAENPAAKILVFSNYSEDKTILAAVEAGAIGYLLKIDAVDKVIQAVRDAYRGSPTLSTRAEDGLMSFIRRQKNARPAAADLTPREISILKMMSKGFTNEEMAEKLFISQGTVRTHISHILQKLNLENRAQAVIFAIRNNLVDLDDPEL